VHSEPQTAVRGGRYDWCWFKSRLWLCIMHCSCDLTRTYKQP
jgi:hypothetical protein